MDTYRPIKTRTGSIVLMLAVACFSTSALAEKPDWAGGGGKHGKHSKSDDRDDSRYDDRRHESSGDYRFHDDSRTIINNYYGAQAKAGHCPPGLAKKGNGCMPPGQAKKWSKGHALPAGVAYYPLPSDLLRRLPPPPPNHRYVQVAGDVLMIAVGTSMVVDALEDILR